MTTTTTGQRRQASTTTNTVTIHLAVAVLTEDMVGLNLSPVGGWVTSAPRNITGSRNTAGLQSHIHAVMERWPHCV